MTPLALRVKEAAHLAAISERTMFQLIADGEVPAVLIVGKRRILYKDLEAWLQSRPCTVERT